MEKIKKALDQAREKRSAARDLKIKPEVRLSKRDNGAIKPLAGDTAFKNFAADNSLLESNRIIHEHSKEAVTHPFKVLRTRLTQIMRENSWHSVAIVSPGQDDGKTMISLNLSISIAHGYQSASILLDLDLMAPSVHSRLGYDPELSLSDYFDNNAHLNEILVSPGVDGFAFAPTAKPIKRSSEYLSSNRGSKIISEAININPEAIIIIDLPPLLCSDDAIAFLPNVDCVALVIREGKTKKEDIKRATELLVDHNLAGVILNDSNESAEYGYYDYGSN